MLTIREWRLVAVALMFGLIGACRTVEKVQQLHAVELQLVGALLTEVGETGDGKGVILLLVNGENLAKKDYERLSSEKLSVGAGSNYRPGKGPPRLGVKEIHIEPDRAHVVYWMEFNAFSEGLYIARFLPAGQGWKVEAITRL
jgi:hypothetical protein